MNYQNLALLLEEKPAWPKTWAPAHWVQFAHLCQTFELETLLYYRLRNVPHGACPEPLMQKLENRFKVVFAQMARLKNEVKKMQKASQRAGFRIGFIKGYPLAQEYYPHMACRIMQDVDCVVPWENMESIKTIFREHHYSILPEQSRLEKKPNFVKLFGPLIFAFELHRSIFTSYQRETYQPQGSDFNEQGTPTPEILFLSVLLHHKFFESHLRDLLDLQFILKQAPAFDWSFIEHFCRAEHLYKHLVVMGEVSRTLLNLDWIEHLPGKNALTLFQKKTKQVLYPIKVGVAFPRPGKRSLWEKICDALILFFVYDDLITAWQCFINKYVRFTVPGKYRKGIMSTR